MDSTQRIVLSPWPTELWTDTPEHDGLGLWANRMVRLSDLERYDDPIGDYYGVSGAGMTAEARRARGVCVECGVLPRQRPSLANNFYGSDYCVPCDEYMSALFAAQMRAIEAQGPCKHGVSPFDPCFACFDEALAEEGDDDGA